MTNYYKLLSRTILAIVMMLAVQVQAEASAVTGLTAKEITAQLMPGWNLGNTFDATGGKGLGAETSWGAPVTTPEMIHAVKEAGFRSIRVPVSWHTHVKETDNFTYEIDAEWLARVKEVIQYCIDEDLYVIVNIHHDTQKDYFFPTKAYYEESIEYVTDIWTQLAEAFAEFDQRLIFESLNEPRIIGNMYEWWFEQDNPNTQVKKAIDIINESNQICINVTRENGNGHNGERMIMCPGYAASVVGCLTKEYALPDDDMVAVSVHAYVPNALCLEGGQTTFSETDDAEIRDAVFVPIFEKFVANGIPVVMGEASCSNKMNLDARLQWVKSYYGYAAKYGIPVILWDNHEVGVRAGGENHGFLNREDLTWTWPEFIEMIMSVTGDGLDLIMADIIKMCYQNYILTLTSEVEIEKVIIYSVSGHIVKEFDVKADFVSKQVNLQNGAFIVVVKTSKGVSVKKLLAK